MQNNSLLLLRAILLATAVGGASAKANADTVSLQEAMTRALAYDAGLMARNADIDAARAGRKQADVRPNPSLGVEVENIVGTGPYAPFDNTEVTASYSQTFERGGKRQARVALAERQTDVARSTRDVDRLNLLREVQRAYYESLAAGERVLAARQRVDIAGNVAETVERRVEAARDPETAAARARVSLRDAEAALVAAQLDHANALEQLASLWGGSAEDVDLETAAFRTAATSLDVTAPGEQSPDLQRWRAMEDRAQAALQLERARSAVDPTLSIGVREYGANDVAAVAGISIPLQLYDTNSGNIERAGAERLSAELERINGERRLRRTIDRARRLMATHDAQAQAISKRMIPAAEEALAGAREGYAQGAFTYLEVLDAARTLADLRLRFIDTMKNYHLARADFDRLTARFAAPLPGEEPSQ